MFDEVLVVTMRPHSPAGRATIEAVRQALLAEGVAALIVDRKQVNADCCREKDIIITVGGDGTFLRASHFVVDTPMLGVNMDPAQKVGFFTRTNGKDFHAKFRLLRQGKGKILRLPRLTVTLNNKRIPEPVLNEVFFGDRRPYKMCRYKLAVGGKSEEQRSSGVLVSTGAGSHAWMQSAGGKRFPLTAEQMEYFVREPYHDLNRKGKLEGGFVKEIKITSRDTNNILVIDGLSSTYPVPSGSSVMIKLAKQKLSMVSF